MNKLLVIDATWMIRRQFHVLDKGFTKNDNGEEVQDPNMIVKSFIQCVLKMVREFDYEYKTILAWDRGTWRYRPKEEYKEYKSTRVYDDTYQCCWDATDIAIKLMRVLGFISIQVPGCEADDLGMYYSHNYEDVILHTCDHDWLLATHPTTRVLIKDKTYTWEDLIVDHIKDPFDLAIEKAIQGDSSDNIQPVAITESISVAISKYKRREYPDNILSQIDRNLNLTRLDRILHDEEVHKIIKQQEKLTSTPKNGMEIAMNLSCLGEYHPSFLGMIGKYTRTHPV